MDNGLIVNVYKDVYENTMILSTDKITGFSFSTQLPGGFAEGSFTLPNLYFSVERWKEALLGCHLVVTDRTGDRVYEGSIEGVSDGDEGLEVQAVGPYVKGALKLAGLAYPTPPVDLLKAFRELSSLVDDWRRATFFSDISTSPGYISPVPYDFTIETKVQEAIEKLLSENTDGQRVVNFAVYERQRPMLFYFLEPSYRVSRYDLTLRFGSSLSLSGRYNKIQVVYEKDGVKRMTNWFEDYLDQTRYGVREGVLVAGDVPEGVANTAGELALSRYKSPEEQENLTINGQIYNYVTGAPRPVWKLRAGHVLYITDIPSNPSKQIARGYQASPAAYFVTRTTYTADDQSLSIDIGDGMKALEQYLTDMGISGGSVK